MITSKNNKNMTKNYIFKRGLSLTKQCDNQPYLCSSKLKNNFVELPALN
jgi:hypothetical protein